MAIGDLPKYHIAVPETPPESASETVVHHEKIPHPIRNLEIQIAERLSHESYEHTAPKVASPNESDSQATARPIIHYHDNRYIGDVQVLLCNIL